MNQARQLLKDILAGKIVAKDAVAKLKHSGAPAKLIHIVEFKKSESKGLLSGMGYTDITEEDLPAALAAIEDMLMSESIGAAPPMLIEIKTYE